MLSQIGPFLFNWLILFVACFILVEFAQKYLYDEVTPSAGLKILGGSAVLALLLTWTRTSFDTMFTTDIAWTVLQGIVWFGVFTLVYRFHPVHAAAIGIVSMLLLSGTANLALDSMMVSRRGARPVFRTSTPVRAPSRANPGVVVPKKAAEAPAP